MTIHLPTLRQLHYLVALAEHGSFSRAAGACHVTQSTFSAGIKELETVLEAHLVERSKRRVALTPLGEEVVARARRVLEATEELVLHSRHGRKPLSGPLRLGVIPTIAPFLLPRLLPPLIAAYPDLRLYLREDLTARLVAQLEAGQLDLLLIALPYTAPQLRMTPIMTDPFLLAYRAKDWPLPRTPPRIEDLRQETVLLLEDGHCLREHAIAACALMDVDRAATFSATSLHTLVQMVNNGLGVTLLPEIAVESGITAGTDVAVQRFAEPQPERQIGLAWRKGSGREEEYRLLLDFFRARAGPRMIAAPAAAEADAE